MKDQVAQRRMLREAAAGIDALQAYAHHVLILADEDEQFGDTQLADDRRRSVTRLLGVLDHKLSVQIASELHESMAPTHAPYMDSIPT